MIKLSDQNYVRTLENSLQVNFIVLWLKKSTLPLCYCLCSEEFIVASIFLQKQSAKFGCGRSPLPAPRSPSPVPRSPFLVPCSPFPVALPVSCSPLPVSASRSPFPAPRSPPLVPRFSNIQFRTGQLHSKIPPIAFCLRCRTYPNKKNLICNDRSIWMCLMVRITL